MSQALATIPKVEIKTGNNPQSSKLNELLEASRSLPKRLNDIESIHLCLNEIKNRAHSLRKNNKLDSQSKQDEHTKAHYLLVSKGIALEKIQRELDAIKTANIGPEKKDQLMITSSNISSNKQKDEVYVSAIEHSMASAARDFDSYITKNVSLDWKDRKQELREKLSGILKRDASQQLANIDSKRLTQKENMQRQLTWGNQKPKGLISTNFKFNDVKNENSLDSVVTPNLSLVMRKKFEENAEIIYNMNDAREKKQPFKIASVFAELSKIETSRKFEPLNETWNILKDFCDKDDDSFNGSQVERKFANGYCTENLNSFEATKLRSAIVKKSREYLEDQFSDYVNDLYTKTLTGKQIRDNKIVSNLDKMSNFINLTLKDKNGNLKISNLTFVNGQAIWALMFYLLRGGFYADAIILLKQYKDSFQKLEKSFPVYLKSYCESEEKKLPIELQGRLVNEFNQYFKHSNREIDPFRYATYKILGRCDLARKSLPSITLSIEDWIWLHLSLIKEEDESNANAINSVFNERYTLLDFQKTILEFGADAFNASTNNPMYLQTLILTGLFEHAVKYLIEIDEIDAVHLAISLNYYGLLRVTDEVKLNGSCNKLLNVDDKGFTSINFARLIGYYVKNFKFTDPKVAAEYLFLICMVDGLDESFKQDLIEISQSALRELVLETREFVLLLGRIAKDGTREAGLIEKRRKLLYLTDSERYLNKIAERAAQTADEEGKLFDSILLYQLSEEYDIVLNIVNKLLGDTLSSVDFTVAEDVLLDIMIRLETDRQNNIVKLSENLLHVYTSSSSILSKTNTNKIVDCKKLLEIYQLEYEFSKAGQDPSKLHRVLELIKTNDLVPLTTTPEIAYIRNKVNELGNISESIIKNLPNLLVIQMTCIKKLILYYGQAFGNETQIEELRKISKNCMIFAALIKYKMPREIYTCLINLEVNI